MRAHHRMRAFDRDLIRGGHYGQRSCEPRSQAEHMAAPTKLCDVKIVLANPEPSTHGTSTHQAHRERSQELRSRPDRHRTKAVQRASGRRTGRFSVLENEGPRGSCRLRRASATCDSLRTRATGPPRRRGRSSPNPRGLTARIRRVQRFSTSKFPRASQAARSASTRPELPLGP